ncbi:MAG: hypothetical protein AAB604_01495 [Patescibacteria group bacterium]
MSMKADNHAANFLTYIVMLSAGMLLLTAVFLILYMFGPDAEPIIWTTLVPTAWTLLLSSMMFGLLGLARVTYNLDKLDMRKEIVFPFAKYAIWSFGAGMASFILFAVANFMPFF